MQYSTSTDGFVAKNILTVVSQLLSNQHVSFCFGTYEKPFSGGQAQIYVVRAADGSAWGVRIPIPSTHTLGKQQITGYIGDEVEILNKIEKSGFSKSPRVLGFDAGFENPIGFPYIVSTWMEGNVATWSDTVPGDREIRNNFLRQLAEIQMQLTECTQMPCQETATQYLLQKIDRQALRITNNQIPGLKISNSFFLRAMVPQIVHPSLDHSPTFICHDDLSANNIIVDEKYNILGIIDWGLATVLPLQFAGYFPRILGMEAGAHKSDIIASEDIPPFCRNFLTPSETLREDREVYIQSLSTKKSSLAPLIKIVLEDKDVDWRYLMSQTASSKGVHRWMADRSWLLPGLRSGSMMGKISRAQLEDEVRKFLAGVSRMDSGLGVEALLAAVGE